MDTEQQNASSTLLDELTNFEPTSLLSGVKGEALQARGCSSCVGCGAECLSCGGVGTA